MQTKMNLFARAAKVSSAVSLTLGTLLMSTSAFAAVGPSLKSAAVYAIIGSSVTGGADYTTAVTGDVGGTAVTNLSSTIPDLGNRIIGTVHVGDASYQAAKADAQAAYAALASQPCTTTVASTTLVAPYSFHPGVTCFTGDLRLSQSAPNDQGDSAWVFTYSGDETSNNIFVIRVAGKLTVDEGVDTRSLVPVGIGQMGDCNIFWQVGNGVDVGMFASLKGNVLINQGNFTSHENGGMTRVYALNGSVTAATDDRFTISNDTTSLNVCSSGTGVATPTAVPTPAPAAPTTPAPAPVTPPVVTTAQPTTTPAPAPVVAPKPVVTPVAAPKPTTPTALPKTGAEQQTPWGMIMLGLLGAWVITRLGMRALRTEKVQK